MKKIILKLRMLWVRIYTHILKTDPISTYKIKGGVKLGYYGSQYGGWCIPEGVLNDKSICYCAGVGEDVTFDLALINKYNCIVHAYDPTPKVKDFVNENVTTDKFVFHDIGLWDEPGVIRFYAPKNENEISHSALNLQKTDSYFEAKVDRLKALIGNSHPSLIKIDIEGAEYKVINTIIEDKVFADIICVEFDEAYNPIDSQYKQRMSDAITKICDAGYEIVYVNPLSDYTFLRKGVI